MLKQLDKLLRQLLINAGIPGLAANMIGFQAPDEQWRNYVSSQNALALNIYLLDIRENRKLRSNEPIRRLDSGIFTEEPAPPKVDCHYLVTAWRQAATTPAFEPTLDEHALLYDVTAALLRNDPLQPSRILTNTTGLNDWPARFRDLELPLTFASGEGFTKLSEFWHSMGQGAYWKPALHLVVPLPVTLLRVIAGPSVTTLLTTSLQQSIPETAATQIQIGGYVLDATVNPIVSISGAWVQLETVAGDPLQTTTTDELGRFSFEQIRPDSYRLRWRARNRTEPPPRLVQIPSSSGEYDLRFE